MSDDLVKRLRTNADIDDVHDAADRIEQLKAELVMKDAKRIEKLKAGEEDWNRICNSYAARVDKLETALRDLSDGFECCPVSQAIRRAARNALEGKDV